MTYSEKLRDPRWQRVKTEVMQRDNFTCRDCGDDKNMLAVHHCSYTKGGPWDTPISLLMTLCDQCHKVRQGKEDKIREMMGVIFSKSDAATLSCIYDSFEEHHSSNIPRLIDFSYVTKWSDFGISNKWFRVLYEEVTETKPDWKYYDDMEEELLRGVPF